MSIPKSPHDLLARSQAMLSEMLAEIGNWREKRYTMRSKPMVYRFDSTAILRFLVRQYRGCYQTHKAWTNRGEWKYVV